MQSSANASTAAQATPQSLQPLSILQCDHVMDQETAVSSQFPHVSSSCFLRSFLFYQEVQISDCRIWIAASDFDLGHVAFPQGWHPFCLCLQHVWLT